MQLTNEDKNKLLNIFNDEFWDFMFDLVAGGKNDSDGIPYRQVYCYECMEVSKDLTGIVEQHIKYEIPISKDLIISFVLCRVSHNIIGGMDDPIKFYAVCSLLYSRIMEIVKSYK